MAYEHDSSEKLHCLLYHLFISSALTYEPIPKFRSTTVEQQAVQKVNILETHLAETLEKARKRTTVIGYPLTLMTELSDTVTTFTIQSKTSKPRWTLIVSDGIDKTDSSPAAGETLNDPGDTTFFGAIMSLDSLNDTGPGSFEKSLQDFLDPYTTQRFPIELVTMYPQPYALPSIAASRKPVKLGLQLWRLKKSTKNDLVFGSTAT